jgi:hypothetical protein
MAGHNATSLLNACGCIVLSKSGCLLRVNELYFISFDVLAYSLR